MAQKLTAKDHIRNAVEHVTQLRHTAESTPGLAQAVSEIKAFQAHRFTCTYRDLLSDPSYQPAAQFFLEELYSEKDYTKRDEQFSRIAGTLERLFPKQVIQTAVALAKLHSLTEELDQAMAQNWLTFADHKANVHKNSTLQTTHNIDRYIAAWHAVGRQADRMKQLNGALKVGQELVVLTHTPGLRMALKMMRRPATLAGMAALQRFLESGFDTFASMGKQANGTDYFLNTVDVRESALIQTLFNPSTTLSRAELTRLLN